MRRIIAFAVLMLTACGQLAPPPDGGPVDASTEALLSCTTGTFQTALTVSELNTGADERGLRFRANESIGVFSRGNESDAGVIGSSTVIMQASRTGLNSPFSPPSIIFQNPNTVEPGCCDPTLSEDGHLLFVETWWYSGFGDGIQSPLMVVREGVDAGLVGAEGILLGGQWPGPYGVGWSDGDGFASADGLSYYSLLESEDGGPPVIYQTTWAPVTFNEPMQRVDPKSAAIVLTSPDGSTSYDDPVLTLDGLKMYLAVRTGSSPPRIAVATRPTTNDTFGAPSPLAELDSNDDQYPTWISADGCRLYLTRKVSGQYDLYVSQRSE